LFLIVDNLVTVKENFKYMHWGDFSIGAEVGLLTRNIVIQGAYDTPGYGGHMIFREGTVRITGAELINMGT
jgi:hypothetical protein